MTSNSRMTSQSSANYRRGSRRAEGSGSNIVCPANWRLPLSGGSSTENGSFYNLLRQYGLTSSPTSSNNNIATSPLYFVRSGYVNPGSSLYDAGSLGDYWSGRAVSSNFAYYLYFYSSGVYPSSSYGYRYRGFSVRCVAGWE